IVVQFDRAGTAGTQRLYITNGGGYPKDNVANLGETNTGDPKILIDFLKWGIATYPAQHYMTVLWNHGSGWNEDEVYDKAVKLSPEKEKLSKSAKRAFRRRKIRTAMFSTTIEEILKQNAELRGILYDDESKDFLDNAELKNVFTEAAKSLPNKRFDIIGFDACLMNGLEVAFQIKDTANILVGSEETEPNAGWAYDKMLAALCANPSMTPEDLGKVAVDTYTKSYDNGANSEAVTMAAVNLEKLNDFMTVFNKWAVVLTNNIKNPETFNSVLGIVDKIQQFEFQTYKDLYDFARLVKEKSKVKEIQDASQALMDALKPADNNYVISAKALTSKMANANGVSIYFPGRQSYLKYYDRLDFSKKGKWAEFIKTYQKVYDTV
ncbi:MAG: hypothetical protein J5U16_08895, partial [Candidatus Methanoperedens sp.]|nr:hypothetical protein [Candidatus Methanoperedens sp.]